MNSARLGRFKSDNEEAGAHHPPSGSETALVWMKGAQKLPGLYSPSPVHEATPIDARRSFDERQRETLGGEPA